MNISPLFTYYKAAVTGYRLPSVESTAFTRKWQQTADRCLKQLPKSPVVCYFPFFGFNAATLLKTLSPVTRRAHIAGDYRLSSVLGL